MKCELCNQRIDETFLKKPIGTYVKDSKKKKQIICNTCQKNNTVEDIRKKLE